MGEIADGLHRLFEAGAHQLIQEDRQKDRGGEAEEDLQGADVNGVPEDFQETGHSEESLEVFEAHPFAVPDAFGDLEVLKGDDDAAHGDVLEDHEKHHHRQEHENQLVMLPITGKAVKEPFVPRELRHRISTFLFEPSGLMSLL